MYLQSRGMFPLSPSENVEADVFNKDPGTADMSSSKYTFVCTLEILEKLKSVTMATFWPMDRQGTLNLWALVSVLPLPYQINLTWPSCFVSCASISPDTTQGVCHSLLAEAGCGKSCAWKPSSAVRHSQEYVNTGTVPERWDSILEVTGSRRRT